MKMNKDQKVRFVEQSKKELAKYTMVGVLPLNNIPDRLVQSSRNRMRSNVRFVIAKKNLLTRILESDARTKPLAKELTGMSAILLSNDDPFKIYQDFSATTLKLAAKPNQISPEDIEIKGGETSLQPGQTVTELKQAGIDVQIQKGKVVIAKDKILVKKGAVITPAIAKALKTLEIMPFSVTLVPHVMLSGQIMFTKQVLSISPATVTADVSKAFAQAFALSTKAGIVNAYTIRPLVEKAYWQAIALGTEGKLPIPGIIDKVVAQAALQAAALQGLVKEPAPEQAAATS